MRTCFLRDSTSGNPSALRLAVDYYGADHVLFGTDAPFGILPAGATKEILSAIDEIGLTASDRNAVLEGNYHMLTKGD